MRCVARRAAPALVALACAVLAPHRGVAQTLDPRAYVASPVGANLVVLGLSRSHGDYLVDPSLPISDINADSTLTTIGFGRTFGLFGRLASVYAVMPYAWGTVSGRIGEDRAQTSRSGLADSVFRFSLHLAGNRAMDPARFARAPKQTIVGASVTVAPPLGQYYPTKLINLGSNRWSFKSELGVSRPVRRWLFDIYGGVWTFTSNDQFYPGTARKTQIPVAYLQTHVSYNLTLRGWAAFDATWYNGGRTALNGVPKADLQNNTRLGVTLSLPVGRRNSVRTAYSWDQTTTAGSGLNTLAVSWTTAWFARGVLR